MERGLQQGTQRRDMCDGREVQGYLRTLEKPKPGPVAAGAGETQALGKATILRFFQLLVGTRQAFAWDGARRRRPQPEAVR